MIVALIAAALAAAGEPEVGPRPDRPGDVMPDRAWDVLHLDLDVRVDPEAATVEGVATHTLRALGGPSAWVRLHQVGLEIHEVTVDGNPVEGWRIGDDTLDVPVSAAAIEPVVAVRYSARPQTGMHFRGGRDTPDPIREVWTQGENEDNRHWYPGWDYPNDKFTVATHVTVPDGMRAWSNGVHTGAESADGWTRWSYRLDRPIVNYLVAIVAGEHQAWTDTARASADGPEVPLVYVVPPSVDEAAARRSLGMTGAQMAWLSELLDEPFPYPVYRQAFVSRFLYGGMENATLTVLADTLLLPHEGVRDVHTEEVVAHELAHQWFGDLLTCYGWRELWLNEGFASFYTGRWLEHRYGRERYAGKVRRWMTAALRDPAPMAARSWSRVDGREYAAVYVRGAAVLHMLRVALGDTTFDAAIREYVDRNADRLVETDDLRRALEDVSGTHLGWLFDQWVHGVHLPEVTSRWSHRGARGDVPAHLTVELEQTGDGPAWAAPVRIEIGTEGDVLLRQVWLGPGVTRLVVDLEAPPRWVAVDPAGGVLARWTHEQPVEAWAAQARRSPSPYARLVALEQLGDARADTAGLEALTSTLRSTSIDPSFRAVAAASLGELGTTDAISALLAIREDPEPVVRQAAVSALGHAPPQERRAAQALARAVSDADPYVRVAAMSALARLSPEQATRIARQRLARRDDTPGRVEHEAALQLLGERGDRGDLDRALERLGARQPRPVRQAAAHAAVALLDRAENRRDRLESALIDLLDSRDVRDQQLAVHLLGQVGQAGAEAALSVYAHQTRVEGQLDAARAAARQIRSRGEAAPEPPPPDDTVDLRRRLDEVEERLRRMEERR